MVANIIRITLNILIILLFVTLNKAINLSQATSELDQAAFNVENPGAVKNHEDSQYLTNLYNQVQNSQGYFGTNQVSGSNFQPINQFIPTQYPTNSLITNAFYPAMYPSNQESNLYNQQLYDQQLALNNQGYYGTNQVSGSNFQPTYSQFPSNSLITNALYPAMNPNNQFNGEQQQTLNNQGYYGTNQVSGTNLQPTNEFMPTNSQYATNSLITNSLYPAMYPSNQESNLYNQQLYDQQLASNVQPTYSELPSNSLITNALYPAMYPSNQGSNQFVPTYSQLPNNNLMANTNNPTNSYQATNQYVPQFPSNNGLISGTVSPNFPQTSY